MTTTTTKIEWGLEEAGVPGPDFLRNALTSCTDPLKAIEEFQVPIRHFNQTMTFVYMKFTPICFPVA